MPFVYVRQLTVDISTLLFYIDEGFKIKTFFTAGWASAEPKNYLTNSPKK